MKTLSLVVLENNLSDSNSLDEDQFGLKLTYNALLRRKRLVGYFTTGGFLLSLIVAFASMRVWEGQFQIVLDKNNSNTNSLNIGDNLIKQVGLQSRTSDLSTEVEILKSSSVLMNIFEYVKTNKNIDQKMRFTDWRKQLDVKLQRGTSVLNLAYRDSDKDIILPVLENISITYQDYSGKKRRREIDLGIKYYIKQIELFKEKSFNSLRDAQQFAIDQDLSALSGNSEIDKEIPNYINIEAIRIGAANTIRQIDQKLAMIESLSDNQEQIIYIAENLIEGFKENRLLEELKELDQNLYFLKNIYKDNDIKIQSLKKQREVSLNLLKTNVIGFLQAQRNNSIAIIKSSERPKGVLIKYKQLLKTAKKEQAILDQLEGDYRKLLLEKAQIKDPWELITKPTLLPNPVFPQRKKIVALGILSGLLSGVAISLFCEKRKNLITSDEEIKSLSIFPVFDQLPLNNLDKCNEKLDLFFCSPLIEFKQNSCVFVLGQINNKDYKLLKERLTKYIDVSNVTITDDLQVAIKSKSILLLIGLGTIRFDELVDTNDRIKFQKIPIIGSITFTVNPSELL
tara:strand:+ start:22538 stop:24241 length:1704 start_codon:yes stop_codon:yes gene_type:complete